MVKKADALERIADALDGGGDYHQGKPDEVGYLNRIANALEAGGGGGGGNEFVIHMYFDETELKTRLDKSFAEILDAIKNGLNPVVFRDDPTDDPENYFSRKFTWSTAFYSSAVENTDCYIVFVNHEFEVYEGEPEASVHFRILYGDDSLKSGNVQFDGVHIDP